MQPNDDKSKAHPDKTTDQPGNNTGYDRRVTVPEAARILGISPEAVRARIHRGTLLKDKTPDGTVYVRLNDDQLRSNGDGKRDPTQSYGDTTTDQTRAEGPLIDVMREQLAYLREQLDQEREANRENRRIIAGLVQRVPEVEPSRASREGSEEPRESPETAPEAADEAQPQSATEETPERKQQRSWLYKFFFGP